VRWLEATERVLREVGTPLNYNELAEHIMRENLVETETRTPAITLHTSVGQDVRRRRDRGLSPRFTLSKGEIGLAEWEIGPFEEAMETIQRTREKAKRDLIAKLRELSGEQFEGFLEVLFTRMGYDVQVTAGSDDEGIDLVAELGSGVGAQRVGIQAKRLRPARGFGGSCPADHGSKEQLGIEQSPIDAKVGSPDIPAAKDHVRSLGGVGTGQQSSFVGASEL
jgi:hypothetical protein